MKGQAYKHGFDGHCKPGGGADHISQATFSVGIFQWLPKTGGTGLKRSAVKYRVKGAVNNAEAVYARAREVCQLLDTGSTLRTKSEIIR